MLIPRASNTTKLHLLVLASGSFNFVVMLAVSFHHGNGLPLLAVATSLQTAQWSLIALVVMVSDRPISERLWHAALYACGIYYALLIPPALTADRFGYPTIAAANVGVLILAVYAMMAAGVQRVCGIRLSSGRAADDVRAGHDLPVQYRLIDLMKWVTLICVALGLRSSVLSLFMSPGSLLSWKGFYYRDQLPAEEDMIEAGWVVGGPLIGVSLLVYWLALASDSARRQHWLTRLSVLWMLSFAVLCALGGAVGGIIGMLWPLFLLPSLLHALIMRQMGWRIVSLPRGEPV